MESFLRDNTFYDIMDLEDLLKSMPDMRVSEAILQDKINCCIRNIIDTIGYEYNLYREIADYFVNDAEFDYEIPEFSKHGEKGIEFRLRFRIFKDTLPARDCPVGTEGKLMHFPETYRKLLRVDMKRIGPEDE